MVAKIRDILKIIACFAPPKAWNAVKVLISYHWFRMTKKGEHWGLPISISVEPTTACNLGCPECPSGLKQFSRHTGNMKPELFELMLRQFKRSVAYINFYFQGEPYINPNFLGLVTKASKAGIYTSTSTNAHFITSDVAKRTIESGLDRMIISIDGTTQETYEQYRVNGQLENVLEGTRNMVHWKQKLNSRTPHLIFQFLVVKPNEHQVSEVQKLAAQMGVDEVRLKTAQVYDYENGNPLIPTNETYSRYKQGVDGKWRIKNKLLNQCWRMWSGCVVTWDGVVVPCCFDKDATHQMGDLKQHTLKQVWNNARYQAFRKSIVNSRSEIDICTNCTEGTKVWT